jgi:putative transposase
MRSTRLRNRGTLCVPEGPGRDGVGARCTCPEGQRGAVQALVPWQEEHPVWRGCRGALHVPGWVPMLSPEREHDRRSIRLKGYDYSQPGAYFVTICTWQRQCLLGEDAGEKMGLSEFGGIVEEEWLRTFDIRKSLIPDEFVVMPNHFHGIIVVGSGSQGHVQRGHVQRAPTVEGFGKPVSNSIPTIIRMFKATTTKEMNHLRGTSEMKVWQRNYYEHVIRNDGELNRIREYITCDPLQWQFDRENPGHVRNKAYDDQWGKFEKTIFR